jgi:hypothetical protein
MRQREVEQFGNEVDPEGLCQRSWVGDLGVVLLTFASQLPA